MGYLNWRLDLSNLLRALPVFTEAYKEMPATLDGLRRKKGFRPSNKTAWWRATAAVWTKGGRGDECVTDATDGGGNVFASGGFSTCVDGASDD